MTINIPQIVQAAAFVPTATQCRRREEFWGRKPMVPDDADLATVAALGAHKSVSRWWAIPGFQEWFLDSEWNRHEAESLLHVAMQKLARVMSTTEDNAELLQAAKEVRTLHAQLTASSNDEEKFADDSINEMSQKELEEYIRKNSNILATSNE